MRHLHRIRLVGAALGLLTACADPPPPVEPIFVRGGLILPDRGPGQPLSEGRRFVKADWRPGATYGLEDRDLPTPATPACVPLFSVDLGDVSRLIAAGGESPDTALAWSPDGGRLAIGSFRGEVLIVDGWTGAVLARRTLSETMVKAVAWSHDGQTLYAGEQSPDALLRALDPVTLADRWTFRFADRLESSAPPPGEDLYGVYSLPAIYGLFTLPDGGLIAAGAHGWQVDGQRKNRAQVVHLGPDGEVRAAWPAQPADATLWHPQLHEKEGLVSVAVGRSADGPAPADLPINGVQLLALPELRPVAAATLPPLAPHFRETFLWESFDLRGDRLLMATGDGRVRTMTWADSTPQHTLDVGLPQMAGEVPIAASIGHAAFVGPFTLAITSGTNIPYGAADPALRPPSAHPNENTLWAWQADGTLAFSYQGAAQLQGMTPSPDEQTLVVGAGPRQRDERGDLFGALVFDLGGEARSGEARLITRCPTAGPVFFRQAVRSDGRIAVSESPWRKGDQVLGAYTVTVFR